LHLEWSAKADSVEVPEGADSFVIRAGKIRFQSIHDKSIHVNGRKAIFIIPADDVRQSS
jgi:hypothetical protein